MIKPACGQAVCEKLHLPPPSDSDEINDEVDTDIIMDDPGDESSDGKLKTGEYVKIVKGRFAGLYATVLGESYGNEVEIQYFQNAPVSQLI